jgi:hypothetical protein
MTPGRRTPRRTPSFPTALASAAALGLVLTLSPAPAFASESDDGTGVTLDVRIAPVDTTAPTVEIVFDSSTGGNNGNGNGNGKPKDDRPGKTNGRHDEYTAKGEIRVTVRSNDAEPAPVSGVVLVEYSLDGGPWQPYTEPFAIRAHGKHKISARAVDAAGNVSDVDVRSFNITGKPLG